MLLMWCSSQPLPSAGVAGPSRDRCRLCLECGGQPSETGTTARHHMEIFAERHGKVNSPDHSGMCSPFRGAHTHDESSRPIREGDGHCGRGGAVPRHRSIDGVRGHPIGRDPEHPRWWSDRCAHSRAAPSSPARRGLMSAATRAVDASAATPGGPGIPYWAGADRGRVRSHDLQRLINQLDTGTLRARAAARERQRPAGPLRPQLTPAGVARLAEVLAQGGRPTVGFWRKYRAPSGAGGESVDPKRVMPA